MENQVLLAAVAGLEPRVNLVPWDPKEDLDPLAMLGHQDHQASQVPQGSLPWD